MRLREAGTVGWVLLMIFTDSGMVKHVGEHESEQECIKEWIAVSQCLKKMANSEKRKGKPCLFYCGEPIGFCIKGTRLNAPGVIFPLPEKEATCD
jgi:hypothetical protein